MKNLIQKVAMGVVVGLATTYVLGRMKYDQVKDIAKSLSFRIDRINDIKFNFGNITLNVDVILKNNSNLSFSLDTGSLISLKKVQFFTKKGIKLGEAEKHIDNIVLFPNNSTIIEDVDVIVDTSNVGGVLSEFITGMKPDDIVTKAQLEILGKTYIV